MNARSTARPALSATRALRVLDFLAAHPDATFTLTELARRLTVNVSSMFSILSALEDDGWITRDPRSRSYQLGFSPIAVGFAALEQHPIIARARAITPQLARRLRLDCVTGAIVGEELVILAQAGSARHMRSRPRVGQRLPNTPGISILAAAYAGRQGLEAWLDRLGPNASVATRDGYRRAAAVVRARGYEIGLQTATRNAIGAVVGQLNDDPQSPQLRAQFGALVAKLGLEDHQLFDPDPGVAHHLDNISAPIFDSHARCVGGLTLLGFETPLYAPQIEHCARTLIEAAESITRATAGRTPPRR